MASRIVIDGNAFYEIDEDCMRRKKKREEQAARQTERQPGYSGQQAGLQRKKR